MHVRRQYLVVRKHLFLVEIKCHNARKNNGQQYFLYERVINEYSTLYICEPEVYEKSVHGEHTKSMGVYIGGAELRGMTFSPRCQYVVVTEFLWGVGAICGVNWQKRHLKEPESGEFVVQAGVRRARMREQRCASPRPVNFLPLQQDRTTLQSLQGRHPCAPCKLVPASEWEYRRKAP